MPRPPSTKLPQTHLLQLKIDLDRLQRLDELRKRETDLPSRTDMVRRLIDRAAEPKKRR